MNNLFVFLSGGVMAGMWVAGMFFLKFWSKTRDRLFLRFAVAFWILAFERLVLVLMGDSHGEGYPLIYLLRFSAFGIIGLAILEKNRKERS